MASFAILSWEPCKKLSTNIGLRSDYFTYNDNYHLSPRFSLSYVAGEKTRLSGSAGIFYQYLPLLILTQHKSNRNLKDPRAYHYVLGFNHLLSDDIKAGIEFYHKEYRDFPMDTIQAPLFLIDELISYYGFFLNHSELCDNGRAYSRGLEFLLHKKLSGKTFGLLGFSLFCARYSGYDGIQRERITSNRVTATFEAGYRPNPGWEFKLRWNYAGGVPYTPFDSVLSDARGFGVFHRDSINSKHSPDYHSLSIRADHTFYFTKSSLEVYLSLWNVYNRKNVAGYLWNDSEHRTKPFYQLSLMPVFGLEYEF